MCVGGFHLFSGLMALMVINFQRVMFSMAEPEAQQFIRITENVYSVLYAYMPFLAIIGLLILLFGLQLKKLLKYAMIINAILTACLLIWIGFLTVPLMDFYKSFSSELMGYPGEMAEFMNLFQYVSVGGNLVFFLTPQVIIFYKLQKLNSPQVEEVKVDKKNF